MKRSLFSFLTCFALALVVVPAHAQWGLTGNGNATTASKLGTTNAVPLTLYTKNSPALSIDTTGRVGIGTGLTAPAGQLTVRGVGASVPAGTWVFSGAPIVTTFAENAFGNGEYIHAMASNIVSSRPVFIGRRSKGTLAAPLAVANNDVLSSMYASGYDGAAFQNTAGIDFTVDSDVVTNSVPTRITFNTGSTAANLTERLRIASNGNISFNNSQLTLTPLTGEVKLGTGNLSLATSNQSIQFPAVSGTAKSMINMFPAGTVNNSRMVLGATGSTTNMGLLYNHGNDTTGSFDFTGSKGSVLKVDLLNKTVCLPDSVISSTYSTALVGRPVAALRRARGTSAAPGAVLLNDYLGSFYGAGFDGANYQYPAGIDFQVEGTVAAGTVPTKIILSTGTNATNRTERLRIGNTGYMYFNNNQMTLNAATGDLSLGKGSLIFANTSQTIQFASTAGSPVRPMMSMFPAGVKMSRLVLSPYPTSTTVGLKYSQVTDSVGTWDFSGTRGSLLSITPYNKTVQVSDTLKSNSIRAFGTHTGRGTIESFNYGTGVGLYSYSSGIGGYSSSGVTGEADSLGSGVHGDAFSGTGIDGYSARGIGAAGTSSRHWGIYAYTENTATYAGYMDGDLYASRLFTSSDRKLKKGISDLGGAMDIISRLKPKTYEYRHDGSYKLMNLPEGKQYGLVAQDVEEVLPNLVKKSSFDTKFANAALKKSTGEEQKSEVIDFKAVNYTELIPILIKGMQEQAVVIEEQKSKIEAKDKEIVEIKTELEQLKSILIAKGILSEKEITQTKVRLSNDASLDQNVPNPPVNFTTSINYNIPEGAGKSEIVFTDINSAKVKQLAINNTGKGIVHVDTKGLSSGTYTYSLYVDGRLIETKKMVVSNKQ